MSRKLRMSLSLDLDNKLSYLKTHGSDAWVGFPSYLDLVTPRILEFLDARNIKLTFFVVGQDAELEKNADAFSQLAESGHEIANHSFNHEPWLHLYSEHDLNEELQKAEEAIKKATGQSVRGFREQPIRYSVPFQARKTDRAGPCGWHPATICRFHFR